LEDLFGIRQRPLRCPGCDRVLDASGVGPGERFKCAKCKKLMRYGPHLFDPGTRRTWQGVRVVLLVGCIGTTVWIVTLGYDFGMKHGRWGMGFGAALAVWLVVAGCIGLAARTTQNNGVLAGVTITMSGVALLFMERLARHVGYNVGAWRRLRFFELWAPGLIVIGAAVLAVALVVQSRCRSV
jgi:hypothetical protein